jgi:ketol-acid reductoisomerase
MIALMGSFKLVIFMMRLTIIGFGNQAKSWALNLKDSGFPVRVALRPDSSSFEAALRHGLNVVEIGSPDFYNDSAFALLTPDLTHDEFLVSHAHLLRQGSVVLYAHGFSLLKNEFHKRYPHLQHVLFAPKSIGSELRRQYELKGKLGAVYSFEFFQGPTKEISGWVHALAVAIGINVGPYHTSFKNETEADLYSEQGLLCGLIPYAAGEMFRHLIEKGIEPELAYFECWHELKLIVNAMVDKGPEGFFDLISPNALIGAEKGYNRLFSPEFNRNLSSLLQEIQDGTFNQELDNTNVEETRKIIRERWHNSPLQKTFNKINQDNK